MNERKAPAVLCLTCVSLCWSSALCLMKTLGLHSHALLYGQASAGQIRGLPCVCQHGEEEEGSRSRESLLAHLLVSPALPGHSSQPLSSRRARAFRGGGGEVLRGLRRTWSGEQSTSSSSYMSDCSQWTCYSGSLGPPPVFSLCMRVMVCVFLCVCESVLAPLCVQCEK